jgi:ferric-dicitrate binding protein FerR (iron transport regulator)
MTLSDDTIRLLLDDGPWTAGRLDELERAAGSAVEARRLVGRWRSIEAAFADRVSELVADPGDLVLLGLERAGRGADLSDSERARLDVARGGLSDAEAAIPALEDVLSSVGRDASAFDEAWHSAFSERLARVDRPARRPVPLRRVVSRFAMAASVLAFAAVSVLLLQRDRQTVTMTADDDVRLVTLDDGSTVRLLRGASLSWRDGDFDRRLTLDGRAYFNATPDEVPFQVLTPSATVMVLGTSFGVDSGPDETRVVLVSGRVAVASAGDPATMIVLDPGQRTRVVRGSAPTAPESVDAEAALSWTGLLFFRSTPLPEVASRLSAAYGIRIAIDPALVAESVTGTFERDRAGDEVLGIVATAVGARVERDPDGTLRLVPR